MRVHGFLPLALSVAAFVALAGCAVPGEGDPGAAATYRDRVITYADIENREAALNLLYSSPHPGEALTLLLVGPAAVGIAEDLGMTYGDASLESDAHLWMAVMEGPQVEPTPDVIDVVREVRAIAYALEDPEGIEAMVALVTDIEDNATVSPRYGAFTLENVTVSINEIEAYVTDHPWTLGPAAFLAFKDLDGFTALARPEWVSGE